MPWKRALKFCWRIWQKSPGNCWSKNEWMPAPFCAVGILQDFVYCSPGLPAYLAFVWTEFCSFKQFLQKDNRREKKKENPRICFYLLTWVHSRPCPNVSAKPHKDNQNFSQLANGAMGILDRNNQETPPFVKCKMFHLLPWVHSRPCPGVFAKPHYSNQNFSPLANGADVIEIIWKSPLRNYYPNGNNRYLWLEREQTFFSFGFSLQETRAC